jgi:uncharacterized paraquat-inducible protein A
VSWFKSFVTAVNAVREDMRRKLAIEAAQRAKEEEQRRGTFECTSCESRLIWRRVVEARATHCPVCSAELPSNVIKGGKAA